MDRKGSLFIWNREDLKHLVKVDCFMKMYLSEVMGLEEEKKKKASSRVRCIYFHLRKVVR